MSLIYVQRGCPHMTATHHGASTAGVTTITNLWSYLPKIVLVIVSYIPGDSTLVSFWCMYFRPQPQNHNKPQKEVHWSFQVTASTNLIMKYI